MSWTYTGRPFSSSQTPTTQENRDSVRFLLGDTNPADPQLQDGEIDGLIYNTSSGGPSPIIDVYQAAIAGCVSLSAIYTRKSNKTIGDLSIQSAAVAQQYRDLRGTIESQALRHSSPVPYSGGLSLGDMELDQDDTDLNGPYFTRGMDDNQNNAPDFNNNGNGFTQVVPG